MTNQPELQEQLGPQARLQAEFLKVQSQKRELWVLVVFSAVVVVLGALSLINPTSIWKGNALEFKLPPQLLFILMMVLLVLALYMMKRDSEVEKYRLAYLQQLLSMRAEQAATMIDPATKVFSRSFLRELLQGEISRAERTKRPLALMMSDMDNFKQVNDRFGHLMGDYVLAQMAAILKSCVRGSDYVVRYGGDEFLLVLPETDQCGGEIIQKRILQKVEEWNRDSRLENLSVAISMGFQIHVPGQSPEQALAAADARMYAEKKGLAKVALPGESSDLSH